MKLYSFLFLLLTGLSCKKSGSAADTTYVLPFPVGKTYQCIQGNSGAFSHTGSFQYAFDFRMNIGETVTAARQGTVFAIEERYLDANRIPGQENYVIIQHDDGSFARYFHLTRNGALVNVGDQVQKGTVIGLSGDTGNSTIPHLHFDITSACALPAISCQTIAVEFKNCTPPLPATGQSCKALTY